ncbi:MAG: hypothetical protein KA444_00660 [Bacteroidia bacterium]|nr:hypothetical protein [Bacteroidia bacterium]
MKKKLLFLILFSVLSIGTHFAFGQYCVPTTAIPYSADMPGVRQVVLNTIDRTSLDLENYPQNSYVNTGLSTILQKGETYTISINTSVDATIDPSMNIRVWIDYNQDFDLGDAGETVIGMDYVNAGTHTGTFTVPSTALGGPTRMRVTSKMTNIGGHSLPTPCDDPADPLGYHGEIEDYTVDIQGTTSIDPVNSDVKSWSINFIEGTTVKLDYELTGNARVSFTLYNLIGEKVFSIPAIEQVSGRHEIRNSSFNVSYTSQQVFIAVLEINGRISSKRKLLND